LALDRKPGPEGIIDGLGVHPDFQGRGLGREGLHRGLHLLKEDGAVRITLTVIDSNEPALALYRTEGFQVSRVLSSSYFRDAEEV
jgi:ribosomal-protein-alanine N-acetyltransferase